jgi:general secretion pathway protein C
MPDNNIANLLNSKLLLALAWLVALLLLSYAGWAGYQRYQEMLELRADIGVAMQSATASTQQQSAITDTRQIQSLYLFGRPQKESKPAPVVIDAPITRLKLTLIGVVAADDSEQSKAIVQIDNKQVAIFRIGDAIPKTNAEVYQIEPTRILLSRNGKLERLEIDRPELDRKDGSVQVMIPTEGNAAAESLLPSVPATDIQSKHLSSRPPVKKPTRRQLPVELPSSLPTGIKPPAGADQPAN